MLKNKKQSDKRWHLFFVRLVFLYFIIGILLLPYYHYQINPDGISYISIAQKYISGDFHNAVNGHFSPLFSWLLIPLLYSGFDPLLAAKLLNLAFGVITIIALFLCTRRFTMTEEIRVAVLIATVPVVLYFAFYLITPDLLVSCIMLFYVYVLFDLRYGDKRGSGMACGLLGGTAFLAKSYSFPFILCHFPLMNALNYFRAATRERKRFVLRNFLLGMIPFLIICSLWIGAISYKYGYLTVSTQTKNNLQFISPNPPKYPSFVPPPNETAVSVWEDPFFRLPVGGWSPFQSFSAFIRWLKFFSNNIPSTLTIFFWFSPLAFVLCFTYLLVKMRRPQNFFSNNESLYWLVTVIPYALGYCLILVDERYIWFTCFLFLLMGGHVLSKLQKYALNQRIKILFLIFFGISFSLLPVKNLYKNFNTGKDIWMLSNKLRQYIPPQSKIASSGDWYNSLFLTYHLKSSIYGTTENLFPEEALKELNKYKIDYFIDWDGETKGREFLSAFTEVGRERYEDRIITIYKRED